MKKHGHNRDNNKRTPTYLTWVGMKQRCLNPNHDKYKDYGGRGITVCDRWMKFENFLADMGVRPSNKTLDRKRVNEGYNKDNCQWATIIQQRRNQRRADEKGIKAA